MTDPLGVNLLPASGEWVYDTIPHRSQQVVQTSPVVQNLNAGPAGTKTDYSFAIDNLQATYPSCKTVSLVCAWFGIRPMSRNARSIPRPRTSAADRRR